MTRDDFGDVRVRLDKVDEVVIVPRQDILQLPDRHSVALVDQLLDTAFILSILDQLQRYACLECPVQVS